MPAPFPLWLPARVIIALLRDKPSGLVIDPYMGSGTTAVATKLLGHNYLGIEIDKNYIKLAKARLEKCHQEQAKIDTELELHKVHKSRQERLREKTKDDNMLFPLFQTL